MHHRATADFWRLYQALAPNVRHRADKQFALLKSNPQHPSLQFKKIGTRFGQELWSARVTLGYRVLGFKRPDGYLWWWIGDHQTYNFLLS